MRQTSIRRSGTRLGNTVDTITHAKPNFSGNGKELAKVLEADAETPKSFTLTIPQNLANPVKTFPGILVRQCHTDQKHMGLLRKAVRRVKEGTSAVLLQSDLDNEWWADSMECYCCLRNIQDLLSDLKTPCERRFGVSFKGPVIPFGAKVQYHPISVKDLSQLHPFGPKVLPGIFLGYALHAERIWKGDIVVADIEELEQMDASEICAKRLNAKEVLTRMSSVNCKNTQSQMER